MPKPWPWWLHLRVLLLCICCLTSKQILQEHNCKQRQSPFTENFVLRHPEEMTSEVSRKMLNPTCNGSPGPRQQLNRDCSQGCSTLNIFKELKSFLVKALRKHTALVRDGRQKCEDYPSQATRCIFSACLRKDCPENEDNKEAKESQGRSHKQNESQT